MIKRMKQEQYREVSRQACRWYIFNQNCDERPWGGIQDSADKGRFVYEYWPSRKTGRGGVVWTQALGVMALHSLNLETGFEEDYHDREDAAKLAGRYMLTLQHDNPEIKENYGGLRERTPADHHSFPRDGATGGIGLCALYRLTGDDKYRQAAIRFAEWYKKYGSDENNWPYCSFDFNLRKGYNTKSELLQEAQGHDTFVKGDWQAGGGLAYYYLSAITGERKYIDDYLLPMMDFLMQLYAENPVGKPIYGFHCKTPVSFGNDDFALVTLLAAYHVTGNQDYLDVVRERVHGLLAIMDDETGMFPSFGGTFTMGITIKVLVDYERHLGNEPDAKLLAALERIADGGMALQAFDYNEPRVHGGFWGQSDYSVSRDRIHHRSTGYAAIFYAMMASENILPYYHVLDWEVPK